MPVSIVPPSKKSQANADGNIDMTRYNTLFTDFMLAVSSAGALTTEGAAFGVSNAGAGSGIQIGTAMVTAAGKAIGVGQQISGTGALTSSNTFYTSILSILSIACGYAAHTVSFRSWHDSTGSVAEGYEWTAGFLDNIAASLQHTDGAYFRFLADGVNTKYECVTSAGGVRTTTTTTVSNVANQIRKFEIQINEAGTSVAFFIDGVTVATHTTNIPGAGQYFGVGAKMLKTVGTSARSCFYDWFKYQTSWSVAR